MPADIRVRREGSDVRIDVSALVPLGDSIPTMPRGSGPIVAERDGWSHTRDYGVVVHRGVTYTFTPKQRLVVMALDHARRSGFGWLDTPTLLECAESDGARVRDLFRGHPAWDTLIVSAMAECDRPGTYRLAD